MVARAISLFRARQTGVWHKSLSRDRAVPDNHVENFDFAEIHILQSLGGFQEEQLQRFFKENEISPHSVVYEELVTSYEPTVRRVLDFLQIRTEQTRIPPPSSLKQSDSLSQEWEERYRRLSAEAGL